MRFKEPKPAKVVVLGQRGTADLIAQQLTGLGFEAIVSSDAFGHALPRPGDQNGVPGLKRLLGHYADQFASSQELSGIAPLIHPGVTPWADRPELPVIAQEMGFTAITPPARVLSLFANKLNLLTEAERNGIPNLILGSDPMHSVREIERTLERSKLKFPIVIKSIKRGGRFGIYVIHSQEDFQKRFPLWLEELRRFSGEVIVFGERYLEGARHIVIPFARLADGTTQTFPATDASLQCRYRKVVEFCSGGEDSLIDPSVDAQVRKWTTALAGATGFIGVGALEFLVDSSRAFLVEGLARLSGGFHLWERVAGTQAVAWQVAALQRMGDQEAPRLEPKKAWGFGLAVRFYTEDSLLQLPQPGIVRELGEKTQWKFPQGEASLSLSVKVGDEVLPSDGGLIGSLFVGSYDRRDAIDTALKALDEIWIAGSLQTNERFIKELLSHPWIREGMFHAGFVDEEFLPPIRPDEKTLQAFSLVAATLGDVGNSSGFRWAVGDQWLSGGKAEWQEGPTRWSIPGIIPEFKLQGLSGRIAGQRVCAFPLGPANSDGEAKWQVRVGSWTLVVRRMLHLKSRKPSQRMLAMVPGRVHAILFRNGSLIPAHEPFLIIESMRQLVPHALPVEVRVTRWKVGAEDQVEAGAELAEFEI